MIMTRLLQAFLVVLFLLFATFGGISSAFLAFYTLFTPLAPLTLIYVIWIICWDRKTPERGGRRSEWVCKFTVWNYIRDYFPISLVRTAELPPNRNYIIGVHPHGVLSIGATINFCTEATGFSKLFPGIKPYLTVHRMWFVWPFFREYVLLSRACSVSNSSINYLLSGQAAAASKRRRTNFSLSKRALLNAESILNPDLKINGKSDDAFSDPSDKEAITWKSSIAQSFTSAIDRVTRAIDRSDTGNQSARNGAQCDSSTGSPRGSGVAVIIVVGGVQETLDARPDSFRLTLNSRKGFVRKALQHGADLVPAFSFGENEIFCQINNPIGSPLRWLQIAFKRISSITFPLIYGIGPLPLPRRIVTVVGIPIRVERFENPTREEVEALHAEYCRQLETLFEVHKTNYGISADTKLDFAKVE